jgi:hypothetical protein
MGKYACNYQNSVVYKIVCNDSEVLSVYVGHTTNFASRKHNHKADSLNPKENHIKLYTVINAHGGWANWTMVEIEEFPCNDKLEIRVRERYWFEELKADLNTFYPQRTWSEFKATISPEKKAQWDEYGVEYRKNNKEKIRLNNHAYSQLDKIKAKRTLLRHKERDTRDAARREYNETHKEEIEAKRAAALAVRKAKARLAAVAYREKNREKKKDLL